jgi:hypothetical protein
VNLIDITAFKLTELIRFHVNDQMSFHRNTIPAKTELLVDVKVSSFPQFAQHERHHMTLRAVPNTAHHVLTAEHP